MTSLLDQRLRTHEHRHILQQASILRARPKAALLTFNQLAEYLIWAVLQPPAVHVDTIIVRCCCATI